MAVGQTVKITWVERGTRNTACLGLDEIIELRPGDPADPDAIREAAENYAACDGIDLDRYECVVEVFGAEPDQAHSEERPMKTIYQGTTLVCKNAEVLAPDILDELKRPRPTELYWATTEGSELLPDGVNIDEEYIDEYPSIWDALGAIEWRGRGLLSTPADGRYTHRIVSTQDSIRIDVI